VRRQADFQVVVGTEPANGVKGNGKRQDSWGGDMVKSKKKRRKEQV